ncbi:MAG TPA: aspartate aminotransferase family protein [Dehalococcoidia bacterium]|nr:aspartate aminotransferase family protein [Dehalococcoidia bacterium]
MEVQVKTENLIQEDLDHLVHPLHLAQDHQSAVIFVEGNNAIVKDSEGREYIDGLSSLWNVNIGHGRKELAEVAAEQMARLAYASAYTGSTNVPAIRLAAKLVELSYPNMSGVYFTTGGAESNESAFKTARFYHKVKGKPDKVKIISRVHGYHGVTMAAMSATGLAAYHKMFAPLVPNFIQIPPPNAYRWPDPGVDAGLAAANALEETIQREGPDTVAAFIAEPVMGAGGVVVPPASYFPRVREICDKYDVLFIADEVITGFGRTGRWFALGHWGVEPDVVSFAKGVTSAYLPLGGIILSRKVHEAIQSAPADQRYMHAATYSGHPTCCAVGLRNVEIMERENVVDQAAEKGRRLVANMETLRGLPHVGDIRGLGMMVALEFVADKTTKEPLVGQANRVAIEARDRGLILRFRPGTAGEWPGAMGDTIYLAPPLTTPVDQLDRIIEIVRESIRAVFPE